MKQRHTVHRHCQVVVTLLLLAAAVTATAAEQVRLVVEAPPELAAVQRRVEALGRGDLSLAFRLTGAETDLQPVRVVLAPEQAPVARQVPSWVAGFTAAEQRLIVLFPARVRSYPDRNLEVLVQHEITHILVARAAAFRPVPRWFNEAVATVAAREWGLEDRTRYAMAVVGRGPQSTAELDAAFSGDGAQVARAYALSAAFLRFLLEHHGDDLSARLLTLLSRGLTFEQAFRHVAGVPLATAEKAFFEDEAFWSTWVPFLTSSTALWMLITALALVAIKHRRDRSRAMHELWEQQEAAAAAGRPVPLLQPDWPDDEDEEDEGDGWLC